MHVQEISSLLAAFRDNRQLHRSHVTDKLDSHYKKVILDKWKDEVVYNQRTLYDLAKELDNLGWYDEEVWTLLIDTAIHKNTVQNTHFLHSLLTTMNRMNKNQKECPQFY